jgi:integrating conjugative element protein (TIGR03756 family)
MAAHSDGAPLLNMATIAASTVTALPSCLRPMPVGVCAWLVCKSIIPPVCEVETSIKIGHRNPDLVVSVTNGLGNNPWFEANVAYSPIEGAGASALLAGLGGSLIPNLGGIETGSNSAAAKDGGHGRKLNLSIREAQAVGHPLAGIYCPSAARFFQPYFLSGLDAVGWRWQLPELVYPQALIPGLREIGSWPLNTWGPVYPRSGWLAHPEQPKSAAVVAQRVGDIVTRSGEPHIYWGLDSGGVFYGSGYGSSKQIAWQPNPLMEGDASTGDWQMLAPTPSTTCETFGSNDTLSASGWSGGKLAGDGNYAWTLWRPYTCCEVKGLFIGSIDLLPYQ